MKTKEELNALKEEVKAVGKKLAELTEDELEQVAGGMQHCFVFAKYGSMLHAAALGEAFGEEKIEARLAQAWFGTNDSDYAELFGGQQQRIKIAGADIK